MIFIYISGEGRRSTYTGAELEYIYFVHSLYLLSRLLYFERGREFFPLKIKDRDGMCKVSGGCWISVTSSFWRLIIKVIKVLAAKL